MPEYRGYGHKLRLGFIASYFKVSRRLAPPRLAGFDFE